MFRFLLFVMFRYKSDKTNEVSFCAELQESPWTAFVYAELQKNPWTAIPNQTH
jgi:hypothetical protein